MDNRANSSIQPFSLQRLRGRLEELLQKHCIFTNIYLKTVLHSYTTVFHSFSIADQTRKRQFSRYLFTIEREIVSLSQFRTRPSDVEPARVNAKSRDYE